MFKRAANHPDTSFLVARELFDLLKALGPDYFNQAEQVSTLALRKQVKEDKMMGSA